MNAIAGANNVFGKEWGSFCEIEGWMSSKHGRGKGIDPKKKNIAILEESAEAARRLYSV